MSRQLDKSEMARLSLLPAGLGVGVVMLDQLAVQSTASISDIENFRERVA